MYRFASASIIALSVLFMCAGRADASAFHTYVSVKGNDANPCTRDQPCRYLPAALAQTEVNGEVTILDSGDYNDNAGLVSITQGVTVAAAPGIRAVLTTEGGNPNSGIAVVLQAPAGSKITFRNVVFLGRGDPASSGTAGIQGANASISLNVEDSEFSGLSYGIYLDVGQGRATVSRSIFQRNSHGIQLANSVEGSTRQLLQMSIDTCTFTENQVGAVIISSEAKISHSRFMENGGGVLVAGFASGRLAGGEVFLSWNFFSDNGSGVNIEAGSFARSTQDNVFFNSPISGTLILATEL